MRFLGCPKSRNIILRRALWPPWREIQIPHWFCFIWMRGSKVTATFVPGPQVFRPAICSFLYCRGGFIWEPSHGISRSIWNLPKLIIYSRISFFIDKATQPNFIRHRFEYLENLCFPRDLHGVGSRMNIQKTAFIFLMQCSMDFNSCRMFQHKLGEYHTMLGTPPDFERCFKS